MPAFPPGTDLYLVSAAYAVKEVTKSESWDIASGSYQLIRLRYQVELKPWSPPSPQAAPTSCSVLPFVSTPSVRTMMQAIQKKAAMVTKIP